jgi:hypothetical protein
MEPFCDRRGDIRLVIKIRHNHNALYKIDLGGVGVVSISFENNRKIAKKRLSP